MHSQKKTDEEALYSVLSISIIILFLISISVIETQAIAYHPINGKAQSFNSVDRVLSGQVIGRDFLPYLGIGVTYVLSAVTAIFGGDFAASVLADKILTRLLFLLSTILVVKIYVKKNFDIWALISLISLVVFHSNLIVLLKNNAILSARMLPFDNLDTSDYGLRSFAPILILLIIGTGRTTIRKSLVSLNTLKIAILVAVLLYWSNDFGVASSLILCIFAPIIIYIHEKSRIYFVLNVVVFYFITPVIIYLVGQIISAGHIEDLVARIRGISEDQWWYFSFGRVSTFGERLNKIPYIFYILALLSAFFIIISKKYTRYTAIDSVLVVLIPVTFIGGAVVSYFFGVPNYVYFTAPHYIFLIISLSIFLFIIKSIVKRKHFMIFKFAILSLFIFNAVIYIKNKMKEIPPRLFVQELGGALPDHFQQTVGVARSLKNSVAGLDKDQRIISTHRGVIDYIVDAQNPRGFDYLIHVLGESNRIKFLDDWRRNPALYATTIRTNWDPYFGWWNWKQNWWFYKELIKTYRVQEFTFYATIWKKDSPAIYQPIPAEKLTCDIHIVDRRHVRLKIHGGDAAQSSLKSPIEALKLVEVRFSYRFDPPEKKLGQFSPTIVIRENARDSISRSEIAPRIANPYRSDVEFPIEFELGQKYTVDLNIGQSEDATFSIGACEASVIAPLSVMGRTYLMAPATFNGPNWERGVFIASDPAEKKAGIKIAEKDVTKYSLVNGDVIFDNGDRRKIISVDNDILWLSGPALNPEIYGAPHPFALFIR